jgi:hypothetical protein
VIRLLLLAAVVFLAGCTSPPIALTGGEAANLRRVAIVPMEPPPLTVSPLVEARLPPFLGYAGNVGATAAGIVFVLRTPDAIRRARESSRSLQEALGKGQAWMPTVSLANELRGLLQAKGAQATATPEPRPILNIADRGTTLFMENWLAPIRAWYNGAAPAGDYRAFASDQVTHVIEVEIAQYEVYDSRLLLGVMVKVIDPIDGRVVGRSWTNGVRVRAAKELSALPSLAPLENAFANDARPFKDAFLKEGSQLLQYCLRELGLLP